MTILQLIYASQPFGFDEAMLAGILRQARRHNGAAGITGALICRRDLYLQLLEGPADEIEALYRRIERDDRHLAPARLMSAATATRLFPAWAMHDDPARSWLWSPAEIAAGAATRAAPDELLAVFGRVADSLAAPAMPAAACPAGHMA